MPNWAIRAEGLGKRYRIGAAVERADSIRAALTQAVKAPLRNWRRLRRLRSFNDGDAPDVVWALRDVSFEVKEGEVVGIIGRNGAGKSTLLKILSRITDPTTGFAEMYGRVGSLLEVGTGFHPDLTGRENVYLNGSILGMDRAYIDRKFDEIVDFSGVERYLDTPIKRYSSGMQVRLAFAVAAHLEPEILVVDEVLAVGDAEFQKKCLAKMQDVATSGRTVLFVSHNMGTIRSLCSTAVVLRGGGVVSRGRTDEQISAYLSDLRRSVGEELARRTDRRGTGVARLRHVEFLEPLGAAITAAPAGIPVTMKLECDVLAAPAKLTKVAVSCFSNDGLKLFHVDTQMKNFDPSGRDCDAPVYCKFPRLPVPPGTYYFDVMVVVNGEVADHVEAAASLDVLHGDYYGAGTSPGVHGGVVFVDHEWE